ncbi:hypothetical protein B9Z19DRAFT_1135389 [Tuber borchii]|uniref:Uncharacterized protein n=1 Tax=Tuber borchii TaxID=42251 RepID=A0A2T6ZCV1_TUBBO|nr:hypothetical protein B9Z19DRAFT_1135389 [Tuber borchii]
MEDISHLLVCKCLLSQETIDDASRALSDVAGYMMLNRAMTNDLWSPFSSKDNFNLASWLVQSKVFKSQIDAHFAEGLGGKDLFGEYLIWAEAVIDDGRQATTFY